MNLSIEAVPEEKVRRLHGRAQANHRSPQPELPALIDEATGVVRQRLTVEEIADKVSALGLTRRDEAAWLVREDRDR